VALLDAKRSVAMFQKTNVPVFGIIENMSEYICPQCGHHEAIFDSGGGERYAAELGVPFLGGIPLEPSIRAAGDAGTPVVLAKPDSSSAAAFRSAAEKVAQRASIAALAKKSATGS
jgi:ATP-binding protein involved in chromosome partitioning